jgi:hypothetical protein
MSPAAIDENAMLVGSAIGARPNFMKTVQGVKELPSHKSGSPATDATCGEAD